MFDHNDLTQARWRSAPLTTVADLCGSGPILIIAPHADDETIGCGGLIHQARAAGIAVFIEILTDGARSHPSSATFPKARLAALRRDEATRAVALLGADPSALSFWEVGDSELPREGALADGLARRLRQRLIETYATAVFVTWIDDPHRDHEAAFHLALRALETLPSPPKLFGYPVWSWTIETPRNAFEAQALRLDIGPELAVKRAALDCHASQLGRVITDDPTGFSLKPKDLDLFLRPSETFLAVRSRNPIGGCGQSEPLALSRADHGGPRS